MEPDFSGYATKANLKCTDGRTIMPDAFKHNDGQSVPLVWQHGHDNPTNVLGHAVLEHRADGVYAYGFFNATASGGHAKALVRHRDVVALSIYANKLVERSAHVLHGSIKEVSLVLSGANPGALIDNVNLAHGDGDIEVLEDEAIIYTGLTLEHAAGDNEDAPDEDDETIREIIEGLTDKQRDAVYYMVGAALETEAAAHSEDTYEEGEAMPRNVFDQSGTTIQGPALSHDDLQSIVENAKKLGSFKEAFLAHATQYGIENIEYLFPDAKAVTDTPEWVSRRMEWVSGVINGTRHTPFSRIKSLSADITHDEARAKGYIKANLKKEEFFALAKRVTTPQTIYKKQKLDRDDIIDITDMDVVVWLKAEMRVMLDEELARAVLVGDGREVDDEDKINEDHIRPIAKDDAFYAHPVVIAPETSGENVIEAILRARPNYRGAGNPTMYCTEELLTDLILLKDKIGRRLYPTQAELESALRVSRIQPVPVMENVAQGDGTLLAILVNISDYTIGADKGGALALFDDFDIDYNQYKYLMETRVSGALTKFKSALVISRAKGTRAVPTAPTFSGATGVLIVPNAAGVVYRVDGDIVSSGPQSPVSAGTDLEVTAEPDAGFVFDQNVTSRWNYSRPE
jgi:hypothetical protein